MAPESFPAGRCEGPWRFLPSRRSFLKAAGAASAATTIAPRAAGAATGNPVTVENTVAGTPVNQWLSDGNPSIEGFTTSYSYLPGETVHFKIRTTSTSYVVRIYRLGWYGGNGARWMANVAPSVPLPQAQPAPLNDLATGLVDCGNWHESAAWTIPTDAISGVYYAKLDRLDAPDSSNEIVFVVRRAGPSDILVQTSDTTHHAYNAWGGNSLYEGSPAGRAYKVSYNRPIQTATPEDTFFGNEYALVRFLERNGYDVAYCAGVDVHRDAGVLAGRKVYISSGHDEYISGPQRTNITAARDAGTHLVFMSGNECFWRTRFEPSIDATGAPDRTLVCYKESWAAAKIDPSPEWTGTWRDARFTTAPNGALPENELTGQLFRCILPVGQPDLQIEVPSTFSAHRFWRNTSVAGLAAGATATMCDSSLGYEFDVDADNDVRPPGLVHLSETMAAAPQVLQDESITYEPGTVMHNLTVYRAASGALVWGTGTVQWSYGLDDFHTSDAGLTTNRDMQQATANMLADMGALPGHLMAELSNPVVPVSATLPTVVVTAPADGTVAAPVGQVIALAGTASSADGVVAGVEVSTDGGATWHPASGRTIWTYQYRPMELGNCQLMIRAIDDSYRVGPATLVQVQGVERAFPCSIWPDGLNVPTTLSTDGTPIEIGVKFRAVTRGFVTGIRFYKSPGATGTHLGHLWTDTGLLLASGTFSGETASGWQTLPISPVAVEAGQVLVASVFLPTGHYAADPAYFAKAFQLWPLEALADGDKGPNGVYCVGSPSFPTSTYKQANYWVDVVFSNDNGQVPMVADVSPAPGLHGVAPTAQLAAFFSEWLDPSSVTFTLTDPTGAVVPGTASYDDTSRSVRFAPSAPLPAGVCTATVAASDRTGHAMASPFIWSFTVAGSAGSSPATLWDTSVTPTTSTVEHLPNELGTRFTASTGGQVIALRCFRPAGTTAAFVGHLWDSSGALLSTAAFPQAPSAGWMETPLPAPVRLTPGAEYVVSYFTPNGEYAYGSGFLANGWSRPPLTAPGGQNGVFATGPSAFPTGTYGSSSYWADVVFVADPDVTPPSVVNLDPAPGVSAVVAGSAIRAAFSEHINPASLMFRLEIGGQIVDSAVSYDAASHTATLTPKATLPAGAVCSAQVAAADAAGNQSATTSWSFTVASAPGLSPATLWTSAEVPQIPSVDDGSALELGVRFRPLSDGVISAIRFFKGAGNDGPHVGHLWTATGSLLASTPFTNESAAGWQEVPLPTPVPVTGGTEYVASYSAPSGHYAASPGGLAADRIRPPLMAPGAVNGTPNGVYATQPGSFPISHWQATDYGVDVVFRDNVGPRAVAVSPDATGSASTVKPSVSFNEPVRPSSATFRVLDGAGAAVAGTVSYDATSNTLTFEPSAPLQAGTYTARLDTAADLQGNLLASAVSWPFTVTAVANVSLWDPTATPATMVVDDSGPLELGMRFQVAVPGTVVALRFYKGGAANAGPHPMSLWTAQGQKIAEVTPPSETTHGWQTAILPEGVHLEAGEFVVSYFAPQGHYPVTGGQFNLGPITNGPLTAPAGGNGLFAYGANSSFPTGSYNGSNYWLDVVFRPDL